MDEFLKEVEIPCQQLQKYAYRISNGYGVSEKDADTKCLVRNPSAANHLEKVVKSIRKSLHDKTQLLDYLYHRNAFTVEFTRGEKIFAEMKTTPIVKLSTPEYIFTYLIQADYILEKHLKLVSSA